MTFRVLKYLYKRRDDKLYHDVSQAFNNDFPKIRVDNCVLALEEQGLVEKIIPGRVGNRAIPTGEDQSLGNNSNCKITFQGIQYFENHRTARRNSVLSILAILISILTLVLSILKFI